MRRGNAYLKELVARASRNRAVFGVRIGWICYHDPNVMATMCRLAECLG